MMPVGTPVAIRSACCINNARLVGEMVSFSAYATASSNAALDDKPAPTGTVVDTVPLIPCNGFTTLETADT